MARIELDEDNDGFKDMQVRTDRVRDVVMVVVLVVIDDCGMWIRCDPNMKGTNCSDGVNNKCDEYENKKWNVYE